MRIIPTNEASGETERTAESTRGYDHTRFSNAREYLSLVREASFYYEAMGELRKKWKRDINYYMGRQLEDTVTWNGHTMTVRDYLELKGMPALSNDIISDKMTTMKGLVRQQYMTPKIKNVDAEESDYGNIFNEMLRQNDNNNDKAEHSADQFESVMSLGFVCDKVKWAFRQGREDVYIDAVDPFKIAVPIWEKKDLSDIEFIAEAHDLTWAQLLKAFYREPSDEEKLARIYTAAGQNRPIQGHNDTGTSQKSHVEDFLFPDTIGKYRYIEIWNKEYNRSLWCHDRLNASVGYRPLSDKAEIEAENQRRREDNIVRDEQGTPVVDEQGNLQYYVDEKDLQLITYEPQIEEIWYYRCISPNGYLLDEGVSPYKVLRNGYSFYYHPYVFLAYGFMNEVRSFEDRLIDKQRQYNHDCVLADFILMNSAKGAMAVDVESVSDMQSIEEMADNYVKVGGLVLYTSKKSGNAPVTLNSATIPTGLQLLMNRDKEMVIQQSGIQPALQGVHQNSSGTQYQMERDASAASITDYVSSFNNFMLRVSKKQMWTMQWHYPDNYSIQITGKSIRQYFRKETMQDIDFDLTLTLDANSAVIREQLKDLVYQAYQRDEIEFGQMLDLADFGDTARLKQAWEHYKELKQQRALQAQMQGVATSSQPNNKEESHLIQSGDASTGILAGTPSISS